MKRSLKDEILILQKKYDELKLLKQSYNEAMRVPTYLSKVGIWVLFLSYTVIPFTTAFIIGKPEYVLYLTGVGVLIGLVISIFGDYLKKRKLKKAPPSLTLEQEMFLKLFPIIEALYNYLQLPEDKRGKVVPEKVIKGLGRVETDIHRWPSSIGDFEITKDIKGALISFTNSFRKLTKALKKAERVQDCLYILVEFARYLLNPQVQDLKLLNELTSVLPDKEVSLILRVKKHPWFPHIKNWAIAGVVTVFTGIIQIQFGVSAQNIISNSLWVFFTTLLIIYTKKIS